MVNAEKHRRKAIENEVKDFVNYFNGTSKRQHNNRKFKLKNKIKPSLNAEMNVAKQFRHQLKKEPEFFR